MTSDPDYDFDFDTPPEPWEQEDMKRLRAELEARPLGGHLQGVKNPHDESITKKEPI